MQLPLSSSATLCHLDFGSGSVQVSSANSTPTVVSVIDNVSGLGAFQKTVSAQPTFSKSSSGVPSSYNALAFNGSSDFLTFNSLAPTLAKLNSFTVFVAASTGTPATTGMDLFSIGKESGDGYIQMFISASKAGFSTKNDAATVVAPSTAGTVDTKVHIYTLVKDAGAGTVALRLDGTQIVSASVSGAFTVNTCSIGALPDNSTTANYFNGKIFEVAVYNGKADLGSIETFLKAKYLNGLNRVV